MKKKSGRRILSLLMALIMLIGTLHVPGLALKVRAEDGGSCGDNTTYTVDDNGVLTIDGTGSVSDCPWAPWTVQSLVIKKGVTDISCVTSRLYIYPFDSVECESGNPAYVTENGVLFSKDKKELICYPTGKSEDSYDIPEGVTTIEDGAFYRSAVKNVTIPEGVVKIGDYAFRSRNLLSATLPESVQTIGVNAFAGSKISTVTIHKDVYEIADDAFSDCSELSSINVVADNTVYSSVDGVLFNKQKTELLRYPAGKTGENYSVPDTVTRIGNYAFASCANLKEIEIREGVVDIGSYAFSSCTGLSSVILPSTLTGLSKRLFEYSGLTEIEIPEGIKYMENGVFFECEELTSVTIPKSLTKISSNVFSNCEKLSQIIYNGNEKEWAKIENETPYDIKGINIVFLGADEAASGDCGTDLSWELDANGVLTISGTGAVTSHPWENSDIRKVKIGSGVTDVTAAEFINCTLLEDISVEDGNTEYSSADGILFNKNKTELIQYPCNKDGDEYTVPDAVTTIKNKAFAGCSKLKSITFSDSVTSIEEDALNNCSSLTDVYYGGAGTKWNTLQSNIAANNSSLTNAKIHYMKGSCGSNAAWTLTKDGVLTISGTGKIEEVAGDSWKSADVKEVLIGNGVTTIGDNLFSGCEMTSITIPEGVITIEDFAFASCEALTDVVISGNTITIRGYGFAECTSLESITIPKNVVIEESAFLSCVALKDVYYGGTEDDWNDDTLVSIDPNENDMFMTAMIHYTVSVTGVSVTPTTLEIRVGESGTLTAMVAPEDATNKKVNWTSSKPEVATVADGVVTAVAEGESIITVTTADGEKTATCKVTVAGIPVTGVSIAPETLSLKIGGSGTLAATVSPENATNKNVSWTSSTPEVATVADGVVTAVAEGESIITVTTEDGAKKATCKVTDSSKDINVSEVSITPETLSLKIGESGTLTATVSPENATNKKLNWTSSAEAVATVADGVVTAVAAGESIITVTTEDGGKTATCRVTVTKAEEVVDPEDPEKTSEPKIPEGPLGPEKPDLSRYTASGNEMAVKSINLKKTLFKDVKGIKKFNVTAGDASAVKIKGGTLMVLKDATVTIEAVDKKKEKLAEKTITVIAPAIDSAQTTEINRRGTLDLNKFILSTVQPSGWKSSNKNAAAVSKNGLLIIKKSGTVKLTATFPAEKGMTAKKLTIKLKVKMPQFKKTTYMLKTGKTIKTAVKNADEAGITYRTEDTAIATVDATGSVTGVSKGTTKLIMTVKGIDYETKIKVK